jgi:hypothetical protein
MRTNTIYGLSIGLWAGYFYAFFRLRRSTAPRQRPEVGQT